MAGEITAFSIVFLEPHPSTSVEIIDANADGRQLYAVAKGLPSWRIFT